MKSYCLIFNPSARGARARNVRSNLDFLSGQPVLYATSGPGDARALASRAVREGFETVIAVGGDGTVNEVINGIADVPDGLNKVRFGVLPMGTVNVFARELRLPSRLSRAWDVLSAAKERRIDLGRAEFNSQGRRELRYFVQLAGAGLDSRSIELVTWENKKRLGALAYLDAGWRALGEPHPLITVDAGSRAAGELILIGNGQFYGGPLRFFPEASLHDGLLDICVFPKVNVSRAVRVLLGLLSGKLNRFRPAAQLSSASFHLTSPARVLLQLDGDNVGELPATVSLLPKCLRVIVP